MQLTETMQPLAANSPARFRLSHHGTMFVYPLQIHLYEELHRHALSQTGSAVPLVTKDALVDSLAARGYRPRAIESEIDRSCYAAILIWDHGNTDHVYRITPWGDTLIRNLLEETPWQPFEVAVKIAKIGADRYQVIVRDTSFLSVAARRYLHEQNFKTRPWYELRRARMTLGEVAPFLETLWEYLPQPEPAAHPGEEFVGMLLRLIEEYGSFLTSIRGKYIHAVLPYHFAWRLSPYFDPVCVALFAVGKRPREWRGHLFSQDDIVTTVQQSINHETLPASDIEAEFQFFVDQGFVRFLPTEGLYSMTGQGAVWLETYLAATKQQFSHLDATIRRLPNRTFMLRIANSSYLPPAIPDALLPYSPQIEENWIQLADIAPETAPHILQRLLPHLTPWKRSVPLHNFSR